MDSDNDKNRSDGGIIVLGVIAFALKMLYEFYLWCKQQVLLAIDHMANHPFQTTFTVLTFLALVVAYMNRAAIAKRISRALRDASAKQEPAKEAAKSENKAA